MKPFRRAFAIVCAAIFVAACDSTPHPLSEQEKQIVAELTANMKTRCIGRYLINMPGDAEESGDAMIQGVRIQSKTMTEAQWQQEVVKRKAELMAMKSRDEYPFLFEAGKAPGDHAYYFIHRGTVFDIPNQRYIEGYKWNEGRRFFLKIETDDYTYPDKTSDPVVKQFPEKNESREKRSTVFSIMKNLRARLPDEIPHEPGVCFPGGFLRLNDGDDEEVSTTFSFNRMRDLTFDVFTSTIPFNDHTTTARHADSARALAALHEIDGKNIRVGSLTLSGLPATEWLFESRKPADTRGHTFSLGINETDSGPSKPYLSVELSTGGALEFRGEYLTFVQPSLTTAEAVALWDSVTRTLRLHEISGHETVDQ